MFTKAFSALALVFGLVSAAQATVVNADFTSYAHGTAISTQVSGVIFSVQGGPGASGSPLAGCWGNGLCNSTTGDYPTGAILDIDFDGLASNVVFNFQNYGSGNGSFFTAFDALGGILETGVIDGSGTFTLLSSGIADLQLNNNSNGNYSWLFELNSLSADVNNVPEPETLALFSIGLLGIAATRRRKSI